MGERTRPNASKTPIKDSSSSLLARLCDFRASSAYAAYMTWSFACFFKPGLLSEASAPYEASMHMASSVAVLLALALLLLASRQAQQLFDARIARWLLAAVAALGTIGVFAPIPGLDAASTLGGAILAGASSAVLFAILGTCLFRNGPKRLVLDILVGAFAALFASALLIIAPAPASAAIASALPFLAVALLVDGGEDRPQPGAETATSSQSDLSAAVPGLAKMLVCVLMLRFEGTCLVHPYRTSDLLDSGTSLAASIGLLALIATVILAAGHSLRSSKFDSIVVYRTTIFFALVGLALLPLALSPAVYYAFETTFYGLLKALVLLFALRFAAQSGLSSFVASASALLVLRGTGLVSSLLLATFPQLGSFAGEHSAQLDCALIVAVLVIYLFVFTESDVLRLFEKSRKLTPKEIMERRCMLVAERYELSPRETEVLTLLSQGRSAPHIANQLYLSQGTINMYLHKTYRKLGVHSKQEALDIVEKAQDK